MAPFLELKTAFQHAICWVIPLVKVTEELFEFFGSNQVSGSFVGQHVVRWSFAACEGTECLKKTWQALKCDLTYKETRDENDPPPKQEGH